MVDLQKENGSSKFEARKTLLENIFEKYFWYPDDCLGSYLSSKTNGMIVRCLELILWSQRSSSGDFSILMQNGMVDLQKESFGEWLIKV